MTMGVGTFRWMAPEVIQGQSYTVAADIYSFGCVLSEFDTHLVPFKDLNTCANGQPMSDSAIMVRVAAGQLKPCQPTACCRPDSFWGSAERYGTSIHDLALETCGGL
ncbi:Aste57867_8485 [Aphanomyces stellatus]|uniref:Aste57867_8485 protein n=1 Tax=Aphanomyces stellatus TaxID=120398 RepID=A0A485KKG4_9STRA|nr:hypothetical protein As57867_008453 [Aphanomyces stellatus]VFT85371.1 Aste57867_8485 [Aphanomyces stellatus]